MAAVGVRHLIYVYVNPVDTRAFDLCSDSDSQRGVVRKRITRRTRQSSGRGGRGIMADAAAPYVREASHDGTSADDAAAAPTFTCARQRGHPRMAMHVVSNAAAPDYSIQRLGASKLKRPPRLRWTASWLTGFADYHPNSFSLVTYNLLT